MNVGYQLLQQAHVLATQDSRRPRQVSLRRAISTAYYGLFHMLVDEATRRLISSSEGGRLRRCLGRAFGHAAMKMAARGFARGVVVPKIAPAIGDAPLKVELVYVARVFELLQLARHEADYDMARHWSRREAQDLIEKVESAFETWKAVRKTLQADTFLVALLALDRMRG